MVKGILTDCGLLRLTGPEVFVLFFALLNKNK